MSIKLIVMKSGEHIIADIKEMVVDDKAVGYYLTKPCGIQMINKGISEVHTESEKTAFDIGLYPWIPLTKSEVVPIPLDWVVTLVDPVDMLLKMYETQVLQASKEWGEVISNSEKNEEVKDD